MHTLEELQQITTARFSSLYFREAPVELYEPIEYTMNIGGKRVRPLLVLMGCELFGGDIEKAMPAAIGIEFFHNFTLLHDDIMDCAPLRRGRETVYKKWNINRAILSGDTMFALAGEQLACLDPGILKDALKLFNRTAIEVCEGQQMDMNFESMKEVSIPGYLEMIRLKTAVLLACSLKMGALSAHADKEDAEVLYNFGINLGMAFQLMDDLLDIFGDEKVFGKEIGGDIVSNKKTFLFLKALEKAGEKDRKELERWFMQDDPDHDLKIRSVRDIYVKLGIREETLTEIDRYYDLSMVQMKSIHVPVENKKEIIALASRLLHRDH